jgi:hypothetical protein
MAVGHEASFVLVPHPRFGESAAASKFIAKGSFVVKEKPLLTASRADTWYSMTEAYLESSPDIRAKVTHAHVHTQANRHAHAHRRTQVHTCLYGTNKC